MEVVRYVREIFAGNVEESRRMHGPDCEHEDLHGVFVLAIDGTSVDRITCAHGIRTTKPTPMYTNSAAQSHFRNAT